MHQSHGTNGIGGLERRMRTRGRWVAICLAVVLVFLVELLSDTILDEQLPFPWDTLLVTAAVLVVAVLASALAFRSIDRLSAALAARNRQLEARNASARALHQVTIAVAAIHDLDRILAATVEHARVLLGADAAALGLMGPEGQLRIGASSGPSGSVRPSPGSSQDPSALFESALRGALLASPLQHGGQTIGVLAVGSRSARSYGVDDVETLGSLAGQAAIALEQDRVQRELRELAVQRERERIARDLHDGIAQVLGYVNTKTQAIDHLLETGRVSEAQVQVLELGAESRSAYVDVRTAIGRLASIGGVERSFADELAGATARFAEASKIAATFEADEAAAAISLPAEPREQLVGIVREALTNVHKHADAARVGVTVATAGDSLVVRVRDDGRGFDPAAADANDSARTWPHYGLIAMRERAASIDATIDWSTAPGGGTIVTISLPLQRVRPGASVIDAPIRATAPVTAASR